MAFGDTGGSVTELIITCRTPKEGRVLISKYDAVKLCGDYTVTNDAKDGAPIFGQALASACANDVAIPVKVRGICAFRYEGTPPTVDGIKGVVASDTPGSVKAPWKSGKGINVKIDEASSMVHVLM